MMAARCESQIRADWDLNPGLYSLAFTSKVNLSMSMSLQRSLRRGADAEEKDMNVADSLWRIYETLAQGEYYNAVRKRIKINGDVSKIPYAIGLSATQKAMARNYQFMSGRIAGTRQIRNSIRHIIFSSRIFYGNPVFLTFTPSERHSGLAIRLFRGRRNDPAFTASSGAAKDMSKWIGVNSPSLRPAQAPGDQENVVIDLPDYDTRRSITARDPLCCVYAFQVMTRVVLPSIFGYRMCPACPHCAKGADPCMDYFGSNATPMGGCAGRCDAMVGAVESQKQMACSMCTSSCTCKWPRSSQRCNNWVTCCKRSC